MIGRVLVGCLFAMSGFCVTALAAPPPAGPPPPPTGTFVPGAVRCHKCNGTGWKWDNNRWKACNECNSAGWLYPTGKKGGWGGGDGWYPRHRHHDHDCFVATAAYGTAWAANVSTLRAFRDECLLQSPVGRGFVSLYYAASPPLAHWIAERPWARAATRVALTPAVTMAGAITGNPGDIALVGAVMGFGLLAVPRLKRTLKRRRAGA